MHARRHISSLLVLLGGFALLAGCGAPVVPTQLSPPTATPVAATTAPDTPTPTPTATPTPTPTPTPLPAVALEAADSAAFIGDWDAAADGYGHLLARPEVTRDQAAAAVQGLAKVYMSQGLVDEAIELLTPAVADDASAQPGTADPVVEILLGDALRASGAAVSATVHYSAALAIEPQLALHIHEWIGDALVAVGEHVSATDVYSAALPFTEAASERVWLLEKMALAASASGDYDGAIAHYDAILSVARIPSYRARIMYQAAETALVYGDQSAAFERMQTLVETHPTSDQAYDALVTLVEAGDPVDDLTRGLVDYHAEAYGPAVQAFSRVVLGDPDHDGAPHHYAGLSFREAGSPQLALDEFDLLITTHPDDPLVPDAMLGKALTLVDLGLLQEAGDLLVEMADSYPDHERAPEARFQAGLYRYRAGAVADAQSAWYDLTRWYPYDELAQGAWYWLGKTHLATGETLSATAALSEAVSLGPWDFYGLQAASAQANEDPFPLDVDVALSCDTAEARIEAEAWLAGWLAIDSETDVGALPQALLDDARLRRATLLLRAGRFSEAGMELEKLREATAEDPLAQYRLALAFRDLRSLPVLHRCRDHALASLTGGRPLGAPAVHRMLDLSYLLQRSGGAGSRFAGAFVAIRLRAAAPGESL